MKKDLEELYKPGLRGEMKRGMNSFLVHKEQKHPPKKVLTTFLKTVIDCGSKFHIEPRHLSKFKACIQSHCLPKKVKALCTSKDVLTLQTHLETGAA